MKANFISKEASLKAPLESGAFKFYGGFYPAKLWLTFAIDYALFHKYRLFSIENEVLDFFFVKAARSSLMRWGGNTASWQ